MAIDGLQMWICIIIIIIIACRIDRSIDRWSVDVVCLWRHNKDPEIVRSVGGGGGGLEQEEEEEEIDCYHGHQNTATKNKKCENKILQITYRVVLYTELSPNWSAVIA